MPFYNIPLVSALKISKLSINWPDIFIAVFAPVGRRRTNHCFQGAGSVKECVCRPEKKQHRLFSRFPVLTSFGLKFFHPGQEFSHPNLVAFNAWAGWFFEIPGIYHQN
jgi:hypothetical protein